MRRWRCRRGMTWSLSWARAGGWRPGEGGRGRLAWGAGPGRGPPPARRAGPAGGERAAVVAFAGRGAARCPLTENLGAVHAVLAALRPGEIQPGGTDLAAGLDAALDAFDDQETTGGRTIVIFSDGEDHVGAWSKAA